jgi:hypothetical protein
MKEKTKARKLDFSKKTILLITSKENTEHWIKTSSAPLCPSSLHGPLCSGFVQQ